MTPSGRTTTLFIDRAVELEIKLQLIAHRDPIGAQLAVVELEHHLDVIAGAQLIGLGAALQAGGDGGGGGVPLFRGEFVQVDRRLVAIGQLEAALVALARRQGQDGRREQTGRARLVPYPS